jgi:uncharacterized protein DUF4410
MNRTGRRILITLMAAFALATPTIAGGQQKGSLKNQYQNIEVATFDIKEDAKFPADSLNAMMDEIVKELQDLKKFKQVLRPGETPTDSAAPTLQLVGAVTKYQAGSRAKRYFIGFGAGKTKIVAHVKFVDKATGNALFEKDVDGKVVIGIFGGDSKTSFRDVGKEVAEVAKKQFF